MKKAVDKKLLKALVPINALTPQHFNEIADKTVVEDLPAGRLIFKEGERDNQTLYLLAGELNLFAGNTVVNSIAGDTDAARHPIAPHQPRQVTARARTPVTIARVDTSLLDVLLTWDQSSGYEVSELEAGDDDWLSRMLQSQAFQRLPPANIQKLLMSVEEYPAPADSVVIRQGDPGDYYYIIKQGRCAVTRKAAPTAQDVKLAELSVGDSFGEDALISDSKRNATITMITDGRLMRLAKKDFVALLREPLLSQVDYARAVQMVRDGAVWLDVRLPGEFTQGHIEGAQNIPLSALRGRINELETGRSYVVCCDSGGRSSTAAFLMSQHGFDVHVLSGGTQALPATATTSAPAPSPAQEAPSAAVIDFDQEVQARKKGEESVMAGAEAQRQAQQDAARLLAEARAEAEALTARAQQRLHEAEREAAELRARLEAELQQAQQSSVDRARLVEELDAVLQRQAEFEAAQAGQAATRAETEAALEQLRGELQDSKDQAQAAEQARQAAARELGTALTRMQQMEQETREQLTRARDAAEQRAHAELQTVRAGIDTLQVQLTQVRDEAMQQGARHEEKIAAMKARLESARQQVLEAEHQKTDLQAARDAAQQHVAELQAQLEQARQVHERLNAAAEHGSVQEAARRELEQELEQVRREAHAQEEARREEFVALQQQFVDSWARVQELEQAAQEQQTERDTLVAQIADLQGRLDTATQAARRVDQLAAELESLKTQHVRSEEQQQQLAADRQAAMVQLAQLRAELETRERDSGARDETLRTELDRARADLERTRGDAAEQARQLTARQEQQQEALNAQQQQAAQEIGRLHAELHDKETALQRQAAEFSEELSQAHAQLEQAEQQSRTLIEQLQAQFNQVQRDDAAQLAQLRADLEARNRAVQEQDARHGAELAQLRHEADERTAQSGQAQQASLEEAQRLRSEVETLRRSLDEARRTAQSESETLQARLRASQEEADAALTRTSEEAGQRLANELARARAAQEADRKAAQSEIAGLHAALDEARRTAQSDSAALRASLQQAEQQRDANAAEQARLKELSDGLKLELQHAGETLNRAIAEGDAVEQQRARADVEIARLKERILELETAAQTEQARGGKADKKRAAELTRLRADMEAAAVEARRRIEDVQAQLEHAVQQGHEADARFARQQAQVHELDAQLDQARRRAAELVTDAEDVKHRLEEQTQLRMVAESARKAAQQEADALRAEAEIMTHLGEQQVDAAALQRVREQQQIIGRLEEELQQARQNVEMAVRLRAEEQAARQTLEQHSAELQKQLDQLALQGRAGPVTSHAVTTGGFDLRGGMGLGLAAGWVVALLLVVYLWLSGGEPEAPVSQPVAVATPEPEAPVPAVTPVPKAAPTPAPPAVTEQQPAAVRALGSFRDPLRGGGSGPLMMRLPAGGYFMGSAPNSLNFDETPRHKVTFRSFAIGSYEVSFADYDRFASATDRGLPNARGWGRGNRPVINVSWGDAVAYTRWLSEQTGHRYRLPSEAEWEYAAAAGSSTFYWWGNNNGENRAVCFNCGSRWDGRQTAPAGSFAANAFGLYDTAGNVLEWVADCRHDNYQGAPSDGSAWASGDCDRHMARSGAFDTPADNLRVQKRAYFATDTRLDNLGLRVVREE